MDQAAIIRQVALDVTYKWPGVEWGDIEQDLHLWVLEHPLEVAEWETLGQVGAIRLRVNLTRHGHTIAAKEYRANHHLPDTTWYTREQVKKIIPLVWDKKAWPQTSLAPGESINTDSDAVFDAALDVARAFKNLTPADRHLLAWRYHDRLDYDRIADRLGAASADAARKQVSRAIGRLHRALGGDAFDQAVTRPATRQLGHGPD